MLLRPFLKAAAVAILAAATLAAATLAAAGSAPVVWSQAAAIHVQQDATSASPPDAAAAAKLPGTAQLWQVTLQTTVAGQALAISSISLCTGPDDLKTPPVPLTGPQCPNQVFSNDGGTIHWTADCEAARGSGSLTVSTDNQSLSGDVTDVTANSTTHISGVVTGTCNKS